MAQKTHDIVITVGEYTKADGTKGRRTRTIGRLMTNDEGRPFILINAECLSTPLFALARKKGDDSIILSCYEVEAKGGQAKSDQEGEEPAPF